MRIWIVEDDADIRDMEAYALRNSGYEVEAFSSASELYAASEKMLPNLLILDIMLPGEDGLSILSGLRKAQKTANIPVMMVTAKTGELDRVRGLDSGADDYLVKPFGIMEFVSRVKALLRRSGTRSGTKLSLVIGKLRLDDEARTVFVNGMPCMLTFKEYELLKLLMQNRDCVMTREVILNRVWGYDFGGETRTVDMHIKTLRKKLGDAGQYIETIRSMGYKLTCDE